MNKRQTFFAHSANPCGHWHPLAEHLSSVGKLAAGFARGTDFEEEAGLAGLLHDLGKYGERFQARLRGEDRGLDHWSQGAWLALMEHRAIAAALAIQGHHIGLQYLNKQSLTGLEPKKLAPDHPLRLRLSHVDLDELKARLKADDLSPQTPKSTICRSPIDSRLDSMLAIRLLFSCLVDADFLDTEAHFNGDEKGKKSRQPGLELQAEKALGILLTHIEKLQRKTQAADQVMQVRAALRQACLQRADHPTSLFILTAPTGSGKTLAMLAFALAHANKHGLRRVVIVIPYLSIIEQTAAIYRDIFEPHFGEAYILEHHSLAGGGTETCQRDAESFPGGESPERRRRQLAENWDAPLIITTSVQLLESLFSNRPSGCRKLHRLTRSVILFDEVQTLPAGLAVPTLAALSHLAHGYGSSVVFATATQPAFEHLHSEVAKHCVQGWQPRRIVPSPEKLFAPLKRVQTDWHSLDEPLSWDELAAKLRHAEQALCIVNLKRHAKALWELLQEDGALHLSTNLCPAHRKDVLDTVRTRLSDNRPVGLIATQCVEAGVDLDFPMVYRAYAPLEAIIQAAGRCNREGKRTELGQMRVFLPEDEAYPKGGGYQQAAQVTKMLLKRLGAENMDLDDPEFIAAYYRELYDIGKPEAAGKAKELTEFIQAGAFPEVAQSYRLIEQDAINIVIPYTPLLKEYERLRKLADSSGLNREFIKSARSLTVSLFRPKQDDPIWDSLLPMQRAGKAQEDWFIALNPEDYHSHLGFSPQGTLNLWIG